MRSHIDYFSATLREDEQMEWVDDILHAFRHVGRLDFEPLVNGKNHYENGARIMCSGAVFAELGWGGHTQRGRAHLVLKGLGCGMVKDWAPAVEHLTQIGSVKVTRVDTALDIFDGSLKINDVFDTRNDTQLWRNGKHGRPPKFVPYGDPREAGPEGRTLYIGNRKTDVFVRIYEKGLQLFGAQATTADIRNQLVSLDGPAFKIGDYVRFEIEFKAKTVALPLDVLLNPDALLAGAYPFAAKLVGCDNPYKRLRVEHEAINDLEALLHQISKQYGPSLRSALDIYDEKELLGKIVGAYRNNKLMHKGIKLATKEDAPKFIES